MLVMIGTSKIMVTVPSHHDFHSFLHHHRHYHHTLKSIFHKHVSFSINDSLNFETNNDGSCRMMTQRPALPARLASSCRQKKTGEKERQQIDPHLVGHVLQLASVNWVALKDKFLHSCAILKANFRFLQSMFF